jgi:hypothetical protein
MGLKAFRSVPQDIVEWARYFTSLVITPDPGTITDETFANRSPASVIGRSASTAGPPSDIVAGAARRVLIRRGDQLQFDGLEIADLPTGLATDAEMAAADAVVAAGAASAASAAQSGAEATAAAALAAHVGAADPHTGYQKESERDAVSGYAGLNSSSRITKGADVTDDLVIDLATKGLVLKDTQGTPHYWRITISNVGAIVTTDLGTSKP